MKYLSPWYYGNEALEIVQWQDEEHIPCDPDSSICMHDGLEVLDRYSMDKVFGIKISVHFSPK